MKQLLILSGKGGTGKTTIASAFIALSNAKAYADCDVDAPNLHLLFHQNSNVTSQPHYNSSKAKIDTQHCTKCGICKKYCHFDAIEKIDDIYNINPFYCEGCGVCQEICPEKAISLEKIFPDELLLYSNTDSIFSTAQIKIGNGASGKLVTEVKKQMRLAITTQDFAIIDGSPGIGCPVIASLSGVNMVLIVVEPSISGLNDMKRIIQTAKKFQIPSLICINKFDLNLDYTKKIESLCQELQLPIVGKVPFDLKIIESINNNQNIINIDCEAKKAIKKMFEKTYDTLVNI